MLEKGDDYGDDYGVSGSRLPGLQTRSRNPSPELCSYSRLRSSARARLRRDTRHCPENKRGAFTLASIGNSYFKVAYAGEKVVSPPTHTLTPLEKESQ